MAPSERSLLCGCSAGWQHQRQDATRTQQQRGIGARSQNLPLTTHPWALHRCPVFTNCGHQRPHDLTAEEKPTSRSGFFHCGVGARQEDHRPASWFIAFREQESRDQLWLLLCTEPAYYREEKICNHRKGGTNYCCLRSKGSRKGHHLEAQPWALPFMENTEWRKIHAAEFIARHNDTIYHKGPSKEQNHQSQITPTNFRWYLNLTI